MKLRSLVVFIFFVTFLSSTENPFDIQENKAKIEQEERAYLDRLHLKSDENVIVQVQNNETNDTNQTPSEKEVLWEKIREDSHSTQKITVLDN